MNNSLEQRIVSIEQENERLRNDLNKIKRRYVISHYLELQLSNLRNENDCLLNEIETLKHNVGQRPAYRIKLLFKSKLRAFKRKKTALVTMGIVAFGISMLGYTTYLI